MEFALGRLVLTLAAIAVAVSAVHVRAIGPTTEVQRPGEASAQAHESAPDAAADVDLERLRRLVSERGLRWTPAETSVSRLPPEERRRLLIRQPPPEPRPKSPLPPAPVSLLSAWDWRNVKGVNYVTPVKQQTGETCVASAVTAVIESQVLRMKQVPGLDLSEHALVSCNNGYPANCEDFLRSKGLPDEACYPWPAGDCSHACAGWQNQAYRPMYHDIYVRPTLEQLKGLIVKYGPISTGMNVAPDFFNFWGNGVYETTEVAPIPPGNFHAVEIIGFDDVSFVCKNSWGTGWGDNGFFRIAFSQMESPVDFGVLNHVYVGATGPGIVPECKERAVRVSACSMGTKSGVRTETCFAGQWDPGVCGECADHDGRELNCSVKGRPGHRRVSCVKGKWSIGQCTPGGIP